MRTTHTPHPHASSAARSRAAQVLLTAAALLVACSTDPAAPAPSATDASASLADAASVRDAEASPTDAGLAAPDATSSGPDASTTVLDAATPMTDAGALGDAGTSTTPARQPILLVHGINGSSADFAVMVERLVQDGWPRAWVRALDFPDPRWGCNRDNADLVRDAVAELRRATGAARVDLVAHSMGVLSTRYYLKNLGGTAEVSTYVTLGGMHHGQRSACLNPLPVCVWQEICPRNPYLTDLNAPPATPGPVRWVSIYSLTDDTIEPASAHLDGAENIEFDGVDHAGPRGLTEDPGVYAEVLRVLAYPSP